jgi:hypothetical protein
VESKVKKKTVGISLRLDEDLLTLMGPHADEGSRSAYVRSAIATHAALLDLVAALGLQPEAKR